MCIVPIFSCSRQILPLDKSFDPLLDDNWTGQKSSLQLFCDLKAQLQFLNTNRIYTKYYLFNCS